MDDPDRIREAAAQLDDRLEAGDREGVIACFEADCEIELLGVLLRGHEGVRRWLEWMFGRVESLRFHPRAIAVDGAEFFEEFTVEASLRGGGSVRSLQSEVLTYRDGLVRSLRLYFDPADFAPALGPVGRFGGPALQRWARRGLEPYERGSLSDNAG
jgi:hypothetical protein